MNVIFLTISRITDVNSRGIYTDLMRQFRDEGHNVYIVSPLERQFHLPTSFSIQDGIHLLGVKTLNMQKTNILEKGFGTILLEKQYKKAICKWLGDISFDLILYSTPPITLNGVVKLLKKLNPKAITYLLLKDIFPQNAVDLKMFKVNGLIYKYFRKKEVELYKISDYIGCMSPANVNFVRSHNSFIDPNRIEIAPNSIKLPHLKPVNRELIREKYHLPIDKPIFIYGGNLGKPQGVDFLIACLDMSKGREDCCFLVVGDGTEYGKIKSWYDGVKPKNTFLFAGLPKGDYDCLVQSCDVGLIFLDHRFTIPNFPSRLLSYLEYKMPVLVATDTHCDMGYIAEENGFGYWCESVHPNDFTHCVNQMLENDSKRKIMGENAYRFLLNNYLVEHTYHKIMSHFLI